MDNSGQRRRPQKIEETDQPIGLRMEDEPIRKHRENFYEANQIK